MPFLVAEVREVVGYTSASPGRDKLTYHHTVEDTIYLAPEWTSKSLARLLLDRLLAECPRADICQVIVLIADIGDPNYCEYYCEDVCGGALSCWSDPNKLGPRCLSTDSSSGLGRCRRTAAAQSRSCPQ